MDKLKKELAAEKEKRGDKKDKRAAKDTKSDTTATTSASSSAFVKISNKRDSVASPSLSLASAQTDDAKVV
jgi:hypothetical protein